jgi:serine beta-lactamase-like protein LACTB
VAKSRLQILLMLMVLAVGGVLALIVGVWVYTSATAETLHPDPESVASATGVDPAPHWRAAVDRGRQIMRAGIAAQNLPALSVAVGAGGEVVWSEAFGWSDLENKVPVRADTRFRIGTASTVLTSAAIGLLLEKDRLKLDDEIQTYVPAFPKKAWPVTVRQLMAHTAGVRTDGGDEGPYGEHCERPADALRIFADESLLFEPGTRFRESSYGWMLLSAAIEAVAGEPFLTFTRRQIFDPLGMRDTRAESATEEIPGRATFYFPRYGADPKYGLHLMRDLDYSCYAGASVFLSTPADLVRFGLAVNGGTLLQPATVTQLQTSQRLSSGEETGYGLGWDLETADVAGRPTVVVGHDGEALGGIVASLMIFREQGIVVALTSNISYADTFALGVKIAEAFAGQTQGPAGKN